MVNVGQLAEPDGQLAQARLHEALALERRLVLAVLLQVAMFDGFPDLAGENDVQLMLKLLVLRRHLALEFFEHDTGLTKKWAPGRETGRRQPAQYILSESAEGVQTLAVFAR